MTFVEWLAGTRTMVDLMIAVTLAQYLWTRREHDIFSSAYCAATGIGIFVAGNTFLDCWIWLTLAFRDDLGTAESVEAIYPLVGSNASITGMILELIGMVKLAHTFGKAFVPAWAWVVWIVLILVVPVVVGTFI